MQDARERTLGCYAHLDLASLEVACIPIVNPPLWELSHIAWFQELWCLRQGVNAEGRPSLLEGSDALFDSSAIAHDTRWHLPYPPERILRAYIGDTLDATLEALAATPEDRRYFFDLALRHEDMHAEALRMTLQTLGLPAPSVATQEAPRTPGDPARDIAFAGGPFEMGTARSERRFTFDNEKWAHAVRVGPFAMASHPVTQGEFAAFVEEGGYLRRELWTDEGWEWRKGTNRTAPRHWERDGGWHARRFDRMEPINPAAPMVHVTLHEARAWCRWAGRRLPSEAEWEFAARNGGAADRYPWGDEPGEGLGLDRHCAGPAMVADPAPSRSGLRLMLGGVWEWTDSPFAPYPGFAPDPYGDYSQPWFHSHFVLRGGSFATRSRLVHNRFRNFYLPDRDDVFAGFRTCAV